MPTVYENIEPDASGTQDIGTASKPFKDIYTGRISFDDGSTYFAPVSGTFTPVLDFGGGTTGITYTSQDGRYTKFGDVVFITIFILLSSKGSSTGNADISGLPFAVDDVASGTSREGVLSIFLNGVSFADYPQATLISGSDEIRLQETSNAGTLTNLDNTNFTNTSQLMISGFYFTSS